MIKQFLILILIMQTDLLVALDREPEIYKAIKEGIDFSNLTPAQKGPFLDQINQRHSIYGLPLAYAASWGNQKAVNWLLAQGASVNDSSDYKSCKS